MKKILWYFFFITLTANLQAQEAKPDVIVKTNGEEFKGNILEVNDSEIKFSYIGETTVYVLKKTEIQKITHGSGRVEVFNKENMSTAEVKAEPASPSTAVSGTPAEADHHNKAAVLPFAFVKDGQTTVDAMSEKVQLETYSYLSRHAGIYSYLDPRTTNALLIKAGVTKDNIKGYTMDEICKLLGVEFVIEGIVMVNTGTQSNYGSTQGKTTSQGNSKSYDQNNKYSGSTYSTSTQNYQTSLNLNVYNDKGTSVFSQERKSFFNTQDAYKSTLEYLLKRTPLYTK